MLIIADALEDEGSPSPNWRWLAEERKRPYRYGWENSPYAPYYRWLSSANPRYPEDRVLPTTTFQRLSKGGNESVSGEYLTMRAAYIDAAQAYLAHTKEPLCV